MRSFYQGEGDGGDGGGEEDGGEEGERRTCRATIIQSVSSLQREMMNSPDETSYSVKEIIWKIDRDFNLHPAPEPPHTPPPAHPH